MMTPLEPATPPSPARRGRRRRYGVGVFVMVVALAVIGLHLGLTSSAHRPPVHSGSTSSQGVNGSFTALSGSTTTLAGVRGHQPAMVWFVAAGCASCAASIPGVDAHVHQLTGDGLVVITLGLYGDFPQGKQGAAQLGQFAQAAAPNSLRHRDWVWGVASRQLSETYDPSGTPDLYLLIGPSGRIRYRGSVPVSTMPELLAEARSLSASARTDAETMVPCC
jgi:hypothetical protein